MIKSTLDENNIRDISVDLKRRVRNFVNDPTRLDEKELFELLFNVFKEIDNKKYLKSLTTSS